MVGEGGRFTFFRWLGYSFRVKFICLVLFCFIIVRERDVGVITFSIRRYVWVGCERSIKISGKAWGVSVFYFVFFLVVG